MANAQLSAEVDLIASSQQDGSSEYQLLPQQPVHMEYNQHVHILMEVVSPFKFYPLQWNSHAGLFMLEVKH